MQDSEEEYSPRRNSKRPLNDDDIDDIEQDEPNRVPARSSRVGQSTGKRRIITRTPTSSLPENGLWYAGIAGIIAGVLVMIVNIAITLSNTAIYQSAAREGSSISQTIAGVETGLLCLSLSIELVIFGVTGYLVGRFAVQRRLGFLAGAIGGAIVYLASFLVRYIPNYPGNTATSSTTNGATIGFTLIFVLVSALLGGLISLFGTWLATRRHPYYEV